MALRLRRQFFFFASFLAVIFHTPLLFAEVIQQAHTEVELISEVESIYPGAEFRAAIRFKMDSDWHIYWKNPGDSGLAPTIEWQLPEGITAGPIQWPYPKKIKRPPLVSYGYEGEVLLTVPIQVSPSLNARENVPLKAVVKWLACDVDCIPGKAELNLTLPVKTEKVPQINQQWTKLFTQARGDLPLTNADWQIQTAISDHKLTINIWPSQSTDYTISDVYFFAENSELVQHAAEQTLRMTAKGYEVTVPLSLNYPKILERLRGVLVSPMGWRGLGSEKALALDVPMKTETNIQLPSISFVTAILFAFLGGLILNLMPCVLPVLSLKILSVVKEATENTGALFRHGLIFTGGVLFSFWVLASLLILLQAGGRYVGWGFQLQSPIFLIMLSFLFFIFALNLFGVFEIGTSLTGVGTSWTRRHDAVGSFLSGILAAVVATPCTAPFMGSALGFALAQPPGIALAIFTSLGLGMAAPYLLLCSHPAFIRFIPKPGNWIRNLKQFLGFLLIATTIWLAWVLSLQTSTQSVIWLLGGLFSAGIGVWILGRWAVWSASSRLRIFARTTAALLTIAGIFIALGGLHANLAVSKRSLAPASQSGILWEPYSDDRLEELLEAGRPVFIDFTAAWCLTCQVNERVALSSPPVVKAFREMGLAALKADWTSQDETIGRALARYGRSSIPLYVLHRSKNAQPIILPELLTPSVVLRALEHLEKED